MLNENEITLFPLLRDLPSNHLQQTLLNLSPRLFNPQQTIILPGDPARGLFFVLEGTARVTSGSRGLPEQGLDSLGPGPR